MSSRIVITLCLILLAGGLCSGCSKSGSTESEGNGTVTEAPTESSTNEAASEPGDSEAAAEPEENKDSSQSADSESVSGQDSGKKPGKENVKYTLSLDDVPIPKGKKITIEISKELADRAGLTTNIIVITAI